MTSRIVDSWDRLWSEVERLRTGLQRSRAVNVNAASLRSSAQEVVQCYFREARPDLLKLGVDEDALGDVDGAMQTLLGLSQGRNAKSSYVRAVRAVSRARSVLSLERERRLGERATPGTPQVLSSVEETVLSTLRSMLPAAGASYEQALLDLRREGRLSYRGTAVELREVVRETLDHLAPDEDVTAEPGFKLEKDRVGPTMRQKAAFVLRSRGLSATSRKAPQDAVAIVDELTASFVRSTYERGSASTHSAQTRAEVERLKMYVETVLMELLEATARG